MTLLERLESASEGSRELGDEVLLAFGWQHIWEPDEAGGGTPGTMFSHWLSPDMQVYDRWAEELGDKPTRPDPTSSLDAAMTLVPEGWWIDGLRQHFDLGWDCTLWTDSPARRADASMDEEGRNTCWKPAAALAVVVAALRAHQAR